MNEETATPFEIAACMKHRPTGFQQQFALVTYFDKHLAIALILFVGHNPLFIANPLLYFVGKIVNINHSLIYSHREEFAGYMLNERLAAHWHKSLG